MGRLGTYGLLCLVKDPDGGLEKEVEDVNKHEKRRYSKGEGFDSVFMFFNNATACRRRPLTVQKVSWDSQTKTCTSLTFLCRLCDDPSDGHLKSIVTASVVRCNHGHFARIS